MEIKKTVEGGKAIFAIEGWLDTKTAPELGDALTPVFRSIHTKIVVAFAAILLVTAL